MKNQRGRAADPKYVVREVFQGRYLTNVVQKRRETTLPAHNQPNTGFAVWGMSVLLSLAVLFDDLGCCRYPPLPFAFGD